MSDEYGILRLGEGDEADPVDLQDAFDLAAGQNRATWVYSRMTAKHIAAIVPVDVAEAHEERLQNVLHGPAVPEPGARVRVTSDTGAFWDGRVVGILNEPGLIIETAGGERIMLPLRFRTEPAE